VVVALYALICNQCGKNAFYANPRKLKDRFNEIDVSSPDAKEQMRSAPILDARILDQKAQQAPANIEAALLEDDEAA
jgi:hypothetical protein